MLTECKIILAVPVAVPLAGHIEYTNTNTKYKYKYKYKYKLK